MSEQTVDTEEEVAAETPEAEEPQGAEPEGQEDTATSEEPEEKRKPSRAEQRINELTRQRYDAEARAREYERRFREMEAQIRQQQTPPEVGEMPKLSDFDYDEGRYQNALTQWYQGQRQTWEQQQQKAWQQHQQQQQEQQRAMRLRQKAIEATVRYPDWQQKVMDPSLPPLKQINPYAFEAVAESDSMADVAYYLASNPQEVYEFSDMTPVQVGRKIASIEAKLSKPQQTAYQPPSNPPSKVSGKSEGRSNWDNPKDRQKMTTEQWMAERNRQVTKKR